MPSTRIKQFLSVVRKRKIVVISLVFLIFLLALYKSDKVMIEIPKEITENIYSLFNVDIFSYWFELTGDIFRLEDAINPFRMKKNILDGELPIYNLELSPNDLRHFDNLSKYAMKVGYMPSDANNWRSAKLSIGSKEYQVKVKYHGDTPQHWADKIKTYQIKMEKEEEYLNNMRGFNLIIFENRFFSAKIARAVAQKFGLADIRDDIVVLKINGVIQGIYYLQERLDANFLEYNRCSNCYIVRLSDNWVEDRAYNVPPYHASNENGIYSGLGHVTPFDYELANLDVDETLPNTVNKVHNRVNELFELVKNQDQNVINYFDIEQLSSFEAFRMLVGNAHIIGGDNFHMIYRATNSKFYPIPDSETVSKLILKRGSFDNYLNSYGDHINDLFYLIVKNDELRHLRNKKVYSFILNNTLLEDYDKILKKYEPYTVSYKTNHYNKRHIRYLFREHKRILQQNMNLIKRNLEYSKVYANVVAKGNKIEIEILPDSIAEIKFKNLKLNFNREYSGKMAFAYIDENNFSLEKSAMIENETETIDLMGFVEGLYFSAGLDEDLYPRKRSYKLTIIFNDADEISLESIDIKMLNDITNKEISEYDTYVQIADANAYYDLSDFSFSKFKEEYLQFKWVYDNKNKELTLLEGNYLLDKDLIIPKTNEFKIEAGVKISIAENKSILSYSPVKILGTKEKPVIVKALEKNKPFGAFAILGEDNNQRRSFINWLDLSGGSEKWINGMYFSGQLSVYHMDVDINNALIHGSHSDDGLNIKYSNVIIDNSYFYDSFADQVDLDFVTGIVKNSEFKGTNEGVGGDNLDLSGSTILIKNNKFSDSIDKGVSIGEETEALLYRNTISNNNIGAAVKDLSRVYFIENTFNNNKIALNSYQKKQLFGGGFSYIYRNEYIANEQDFAKDEKSKIYKIDLTEDSYTSLVDNIENDNLIFPSFKT